MIRRKTKLSVNIQNQSFQSKMLFVRCRPSYMCPSENEREHGIDNEKMWQSYLKKKVLKKKFQTKNLLLNELLFDKAD